LGGILLRSVLAAILREYPYASGKKFQGNKTAVYIRSNAANAVARCIPNADSFKVKGSPGLAKWADVPWIGIRNPVRSESFQEGIYVVYLFLEDMKGAYISLNQGTERIWNKLGSAAAEGSLRQTASAYRDILGKHGSRFDRSSINLHVSNPSGRGARYEVGNICARYYDARTLPTERALRSDLRNMLEVYDLVSSRRLGPFEKESVEEDEADLLEEDYSRMRDHKAIERSAAVAKKVKKLQGYECRACGMSFEKRYGNIGHRFIEAHHLRPISKATSGKVRLHPLTDFAVLCSNCHRMIHKYKDASDLGGFKKQIRK
jgi:5-methylcytosine-specific restriction protein A